MVRRCPRPPPPPPCTPLPLPTLAAPPPLALPQVSPPELAARRAGISLHEAFAVDQVNLVERLGQEVFLSLSREFYDRVYADPDPSFQ